MGVLLCFIGATFCQFKLLNPQSRGFSSRDAHMAPCGQSPNVPSDDSERAIWDHDIIRDIEVMIVGPHGGGVIEDRWSCTLMGSPHNDMSPLFPIRGGLKIEIPDRAGQIYRLKVRTPSTRCTGRATFQLVYSTRTGGEFYQCQDVIIYNTDDSVSSGASSIYGFFGIAVA